MVTVKLLKPYYIKADEEVVRIILAYQYFSVLINNQLYQFIPVDAKEVRINRKTEKVENTDAIFAFQKGKEVIRIAMTELILLPDFLDQIISIVEPYFDASDDEEDVDTAREVGIERLIADMERKNVKRLIDNALDDRDEESFRKLTRLL